MLKPNWTPATPDKRHAERDASYGSNRTLRPRLAQWIGQSSQAKRRIAVFNASGCSRLTICGASGMTTSVERGDACVHLAAHHVGG
jgi:hypothetical protein